LAFEFAHGVEHGFVFGFDGDEVFTFGFVEVCRAFDGEVVGLGRAAGEDDFFWIGVNQGGDVGASFFDGFFRCPAECVAVGSGVAEGFG
jgi:putative suprabasin